MISPNPVIELWDIEKIIPYAANAKKHPPEQVKKLASAIEKFGWTQPIVVWTDGEIIAGHGRRLAALHLGLKKVPVVVRSDLSKAAADALRLADNRVSSTEYDQSLIQDELRRLSSELEGTLITMSDLGFDERELEFTLSDLGEMDDDLFADDLNEAMAQQKAENEEAIGDADGAMAPVGDALGFKRVTVAQSREIRGLMNRIFSANPDGGANAFIEALRKGAPV